MLQQYFSHQNCLTWCWIRRKPHFSVIKLKRVWMNGKCDSVSTIVHTCSYFSPNAQSPQEVELSAHRGNDPLMFTTKSVLPSAKNCHTKPQNNLAKQTWLHTTYHQTPFPVWAIELIIWECDHKHTCPHNEGIFVKRVVWFHLLWDRLANLCWCRCVGTRSLLLNVPHRSAKFIYLGLIQSYYTVFIRQYCGYQWSIVVWVF
mgnify:CR=1 FL=1